MCKLPGHQTCVGDTPGGVWCILAVGFGCFPPVGSLHTSKAGPYHVVFVNSSPRFPSPIPKKWLGMRSTEGGISISYWLSRHKWPHWLYIKLCKMWKTQHVDQTINCPNSQNKVSCLMSLKWYNHIWGRDAETFLQVNAAWRPSYVQWYVHHPKPFAFSSYSLGLSAS